MKGNKEWRRVVRQGLAPFEIDYLSYLDNYHCDVRYSCVPRDNIKVSRSKQVASVRFAFFIRGSELLVGIEKVVCVCVCVCDRDRQRQRKKEREREREREREWFAEDLFGIMTVSPTCKMSTICQYVCSLMPTSYLSRQLMHEKTQRC